MSKTELRRLAADALLSFVAGGGTVVKCPPERARWSKKTYCPLTGERYAAMAKSRGF